ncbi:MAG: hypothetical protein OEX04_16860 [Acidimicrobiia bacterium]|nr:hypothetical protein [Acidimicrobiia bacterium]
MLVFDRGSVSAKRPQRLVAAYPRSALTGASSRKAGLKRDLVLSFADGSSLQLDGGLKGPYETFEKAAAGRI